MNTPTRLIPHRAEPPEHTAPRASSPRCAARRRTAPRMAAAGLTLALGACTVGPDYRPPETGVPHAWSAAGGAAGPGGSVTISAEPAAIAAWWTVLDDPLLTDLVERGVAANLDIAQAIARVRFARATRDIAAAGDWPVVDATSSAARARTGGGRGGSTGNFYRAGLDASWEIDIFGGIRRAVEAADADLAAAAEDARSVRVTVAAEIGLSYADLRGAQRRLGVARRQLAQQEQTASIVQQRFDAGFVTALDVANAQAQLADTRSRVPSLEASERQSAHALAVLLGLEPAALLGELTPEAPLPGLPARVPVGLPSELLLRRPDVRAAEAALHAQTARIGVATAALYPRFFLTGSAGIEGPRASSLVSIADRFWSVGPQVSWRVFDAGRNEAAVRVQEALADQSFAAYRQTILTALREVEDALVGYAKEQQRRAALVDSVTANRSALALATTRYREGATDFLDVLTTQRLLDSAEDALASSDQQIVRNLVTLYRVLGGGWEQGTPDDPAAADEPAPGPRRGP